MALLLTIMLWNLLFVIPLGLIVWIAARTSYLRHRPAVTHLLWLLVLAKFITPAVFPMEILPTEVSAAVDPLVIETADELVTPPQRPLPVPVPISVPNPESATTTKPADAAPRAFSLAHIGGSVLSVFLIISLSITILIWIATFRRWFHANELLSRCDVASEYATHVLHEVSHAFIYTPPPRLAVLAGNISPFLWLTPRSATIVLSESDAATLEAERLRHIFAHELAHLRQRDGWTSLFAYFIQTFFWWHPVAWIARREMFLAAESACDARAVEALSGSRRSYAETLLAITDRPFGNGALCMAPAAIPFSSTRVLRKRIELIASSRTTPTASWVAILCILPLASSLLVMPTDAQQPEQQSSSKRAESAVTATVEENHTNAETDDGQDDHFAVDEIAGVVVDENGNPLRHVKVDVWSWFSGNETLTDLEGRFRVRSGDARETPDILFTASNYSPRYYSMYLLSQTKLDLKHMRVVLDKSTLLQGAVRDTQGKPVAGATIRAEMNAQNEWGNDIGTVVTTGLSDASGNYQLPLYPEKYEILVAVEGRGATRIADVSVTKGEAKKLDIQLQQAVRFEAHVIDSQTKEPYTGGLVLWDWQNRSVLGFSDEEGHLVIDGMLPGVYHFSVGQGESISMMGMSVFMHGELGRWWSPDATSEWERRTMDDGTWQRNFDGLSFDLQVGMQAVTIEVERGVTFSGHVYDPDGEPVAGATVAPAKTGSGNSLTGDTRYSTRTEQDGSYRVVMPAGNDFEYNLICHDGDYQEWRHWANGVSETIKSRPGDKFEKFDLHLTRPATVRGILKGPLGVSAAGKQVRAHAADRKENRYYDPTTETHTGEHGVFELKFVRPGKHYIQVEPFWLDASLAPEGASVTIDVAEGQTYEGIELRLPEVRANFDFGNGITVEVPPPNDSTP